MVEIAFRVFPSANVVSLFEEAPGGGDIEDITSLRNRPARFPEQWLANVYLHSSLDNMEVLADTTVSISHASVAATTAGGLSTSNGAGSAASQLGAAQQYRASSATHLLLSHGLGYVPDCAVVVDNSKVIFPGMPVQALSGGRARYCTPYVTATEIRLHEWTSVGSSALASQTRSYRVIAFRQQRAPESGKPVFGRDAATGDFMLARGRLASSRKYLQIVEGGTPFAIVYGKQMDLNRGAVRYANPDGSYTETVPSGQRARLQFGFLADETVKTRTLGWSDYWDYSGTFVPGDRILVSAP